MKATTGDVTKFGLKGVIGSVSPIDDVRIDQFVVGLMLSSFGVFWTGEGLGADWPGDDLALLWIFVVFLVFSLSAVRLMARPKTEVAI